MKEVEHYDTDQRPIVIVAMYFNHVANPYDDMLYASRNDLECKPSGNSK